MKHSIINPDPQSLIGECAICGPNTPLKFYKGKPLAGGTGYGSFYVCRIQYNETKRESAKRKRTPEKMRVNHLKRYGMTPESFDTLFESQGKACVICRRTDPVGHGWHIDHNHNCCKGIKSCGNCVRGILCSNCNTALGLLQDDPVRIRVALEYLRTRR